MKIFKSLIFLHQQINILCHRWSPYPKTNSKFRSNHQIVADWLKNSRTFVKKQIQFEIRNSLTGKHLFELYFVWFALFKSANPHCTYLLTLNGSLELHVALILRILWKQSSDFHTRIWSSPISTQTSLNGANALLKSRPIINGFEFLSGNDFMNSFVCFLFIFIKNWWKAWIHIVWYTTRRKSLWDLWDLSKKCQRKIIISDFNSSFFSRPFPRRQNSSRIV